MLWSSVGHKLRSLDSDTQQVSAVAWLFFALGWGSGNWLVRIVSIRESLHLSHRELGIILLASAVGAMTTFLSNDKMTAYVRLPLLALIAAVLYFICLPLAGLARDPLMLAVVLYAMGASSGLLNVLMNGLAVDYEYRTQRSVLGKLHATCSFGGLFGAFCGSALIGLQLTTTMHMLIVACVLLLGTAVVCGTLRDWQIAKQQVEHVEIVDMYGRKKQRKAPLGSIRVLSLMVVCSAICEGGMADWTGLYLRESLGATVTVSGRGYMIFALAMVATRSIIDNIRQTVGTRQLVIASGMIAAAGVMLELLTSNMWITLLGISLVGFGLSCTVPILYREATQNNPKQKERALSRMSSASYVGFLIGPPMIGYFADLMNLRFALSMIGALSILIAICGMRLARRTSAIAPIRP